MWYINTKMDIKL